MANLRERIEGFLAVPLPEELAEHYAPENITEMLMSYYLAGESFDAEACDMLHLCAMEAEDAVARHSTQEAKDFFRESGAIIGAILAENCSAV